MGPLTPGVTVHDSTLPSRNHFLSLGGYIYPRNVTQPSYKRSPGEYGTHSRSMRAEGRWCARVSLALLLGYAAGFVPVAPGRRGRLELRGGAGMAGSSARPEGLPAAPSKERGCELWRPLPEEEVSCCGPLTAAQIDEFYADGFVLVRGLVKDGDLLRRTRDACLKTMDMDPARKEAGTGLEGSFPLLEASMDGSKPQGAFLSLAMHPDVAQAVAQLTPSVASGEQDLHAIQDATFVFRAPIHSDTTRSDYVSKGCDWHVDDEMFWPASLDAAGPGVNVWIALDTVTEEGGGFAVAARSHTRDFLDCRDAIAKDTCDMANLFPEGRARLEALAVVPQMQPGDAILHTRYLFHRTDPFRPGSAASRGPGICRYTCRCVSACNVCPCVTCGNLCMERCARAGTCLPTLASTVLSALPAPTPWVAPGCLSPSASPWLTSTSRPIVRA